MNIKFRMPRLGNKLKGQSMLKEMTMTIIATTISIVLTFGSASIVEKNQKEKNRRQTILMVLYDIDKSVDKLIDWKEGEEEYIEITRHVLNNFDNIDNISSDTLKWVYQYLQADVMGYTMDDSKELIFQNNQSEWSSLEDNMKLVDVVQDFYNVRREDLVYLNKNHYFKEPISHNEDMEIQCEGSYDFYPTDLKRILKEKLRDKRVRFYIEYSTWRRYCLSSMIDRWKQKSNRIKFLMGITDEELNSYVDNFEQMGRSVTKKDLVGKWIRSDSVLTGRYWYWFRKDGTFKTQWNNEQLHDLYTGSIISTITCAGNWEFKGDSIVLNCRPDSLQVKYDFSKIHYNKELQDTVNIFIKEHKEFWKKNIKTMRENLPRLTYIIRTDASGEKIELIDYDDKDAKESDKSIIYLIKE